MKVTREYVDVMHVMGLIDTRLSNSITLGILGASLILINGELGAITKTLWYMGIGLITIAFIGISYAIVKRQKYTMVRDSIEVSNLPRNEMELRQNEQS